MKASDWTYQDTLSPESFFSMLAVEYNKMMPQQSKQRKDGVIIGPWEIWDSQKQTRLQTWKLAPASSLKTQLYKSEGERGEGKFMSQQCWPDGCDILPTMKSNNFLKFNIWCLILYLNSTESSHACQHIFKHVFHFLILCNVIICVTNMCFNKGSTWLNLISYHIVYTFSVWKLKS